MINPADLLDPRNFKVSTTAYLVTTTLVSVIASQNSNRVDILIFNNGAGQVIIGTNVTSAGTIQGGVLLANQSLQFYYARDPGLTQAALFAQASGAATSVVVIESVWNPQVLPEVITGGDQFPETA